MKEKELIYLPLSDVKPYEKNARINDKAVESVANSIKEYGFKNPIIIDKDYVIICGHTRLKAAQKLKLKTVPCIIADDLSPEKVKAFRIADNKTGEIADWDFELLESEIKELLSVDYDISSLGFNELELNEIVNKTLEDMNEYLDLRDGVSKVQEDEEVLVAEEDDFDCTPPEEPKSKLGDIYQLGNHRLMCGDSTKIDDVERLMNGEKADLLITDPPYNVNYEGKTKDKMKIKNDSMENDTFHKFLYDVFVNVFTVLNDGSSFYVWYASREVVNFHTSIEESGLSVKQELIWNKNCLVMGRQDYQWKHEPCLYGWKETGSHNWYSDRTQTTVIDFDKPARSDLHPTMKPVGLFDYQIKNSSKKNDIVLDLFGGSGTTIIACEQNNRNCYMMEYDPKYVDVIINRWETLTGKKAVLLNN